jgi:putative phage-type endonuclease
MTPEQLAERRRYIGASEAAAACGLSPWMTPFELWQSKTSTGVSDVDSPAMEWGRRLESVVLAKYAEDTRTQPEAPCAFRASFAYPWMGCTPDALLPDRVVEVKTAGLAKAREWGDAGTDAVPLHYLLQVTHQMIVTGRRKADIPVLIGGSDYRVYSVDYDPELAAMLIERESEFWMCVESGTPPDVKTIKDATARWPKDTGEIVVATAPIAEAIVRLREIEERQKALEADADALGLAVRACMADAATLTDSAGNVLATWKAQQRHTLDQKALKAAHPALHAEFTTTATSRVFRLNRSSKS